MATLNDLLTARIPPHSLEAERALLGLMLLDADAIARILEKLKPEDFYLSKHQKIFTAMLTLFGQGVGVDDVTVANELTRRKEYEEIGGLVMLAGLIEEAAIQYHVDAYAEIVLEKAHLRDLIRTGTELIGECYEGARPATEVVATAESRMLGLMDRRERSKIIRVGDSFPEMFERLERMKLTTQELTGVATGYRDLDNLTGGFQPADVVILAARPSIGKSALALDIARYVTMMEGSPTLVMSIEMPYDQCRGRLIAAEARVDWSKIRRGGLEPEEMDRIQSAAERLSDLPLYIDDTPRLTPMELRAKVRRVPDLKFLIIDYLQLMTTGRRMENRQQEVSEISRSVKALAKDLGIPILALSQLSRAIEQREKKEPLLSDLRESGSLEQDADTVLFLYRPEAYGLSEDGEAQIIIGKQRNGPTGRCPVTFLKPYSTFVQASYRNDLRE